MRRRATCGPTPHVARRVSRRCPIERRRTRWRGWIAPAALAVALLSLAGNAYLLWQLRHPERWAAPAAARLLEGWLGPEATLRHTVRIPAGTPLRLDIPVDESFSVRVDTVIPINTTVRVPIRGPLGVYDLDLPIRANVPVRTALPLRIRHTFDLSTRTSREIAIPIEIRVGELLEGMTPVDPLPANR